MLKISEKYLNKHLQDSDFETIRAQVDAAVADINEGSTPGSDFLGWLKLPSSIDKDLLADIKTTAAEIQAHSDYLVCVGIGGSYLGTKAVYEAFRPYFAEHDQNLKLLFAGQNISEDYLFELLEFLSDKKFSLNVISKSGTTTEPAIAYRFLRNLLSEKFGTEANKRLYFTTDSARGALRKQGNEEGIKSFCIPDDVGGRYSVLTPVGLLPLAAAGLDIDELLEGARQAESKLLGSSDLGSNPALRYAVIRNALYRKGYTVEALVSFEPRLAYLAEWWKQLYAESEGKDGKGLFPASMIFSTDLHSLGQFVQEGRNCLFETAISVGEAQRKLTLPVIENSLDGLDYLAEREIFEVKKTAARATFMAHHEGGVPIVEIELSKLDLRNFGYLLYFMEYACAISGRLLAVNPFDQPGVEAYKKNMFALLGKPGFEDLRADLERK